MGKKKVRKPSASKKKNHKRSTDFTEETLDNENYEVSLTQADIVNIIKFQYKWYGSHSNVIFEVIRSTAHLKSNLHRYKNRLKKPDKKSLTLIINLNQDESHWVSLFIVYRDSNFFAYYIDPLGNEKLPDGIREDLQRSFRGIEPTAVPIEQQCDINNCGILALEYARILNEGLKKDWPTGLIIGLYHVWHYKPTGNDLKDVRINFARKLRDPNFVSSNIPFQNISQDSQLSLQTSGSAGTEKERSSEDRSSELGSSVPDVIKPIQESHRSCPEFNEKPTSINDKLLTASGCGDLEEVERLIKEKADVNCSDIHGNRPLHRAVKSGELEVVKLLLDEAEEIHEFNNEHETPLDIAIENNNQSIIDALVRKIEEDAWKLMEDISSKNPEPTESKSREKLTPGEEAIEKIKEKILSCLETLKILNERQTNAGDQLTYEHAIVLIYFVEALSLEGSGNTDVKTEMEKHFALCYTNEDRDRIRMARHILLKSPGKKLGLEDVRKFFKSDVKSFFMQLQQYLESVKINLQMADIFAAMRKAVATKTAKTCSPTGNVGSGSPVAQREAKRKKIRNEIESSMESFRNLNKNEDKNKNIIPREKYNIVWNCYTKLFNLGDFSNTDIQIMIMDRSDHNDKVMSLGDVSKLKQCMELIIERGSECEAIRLDTFLTDFGGKDDNSKGKPTNVEGDEDIDVLLRDEFQKLIETSSRKENITQEHLFNFVVNFYPTFIEAIGNNKSGDFEELRTLRNSLIHEFHEHGFKKYADNVSKLKHKLFRYRFAQVVHDELVPYGYRKAKRIDALHGQLKTRLEEFNKQLQHVLETEHVIPEESATRNFEYLEIEDVEISVKRYLWFTILIDKPKSAQHDPHVQLKDYFFDPGSSTKREEPISLLSDSERRKLFDEFCSVGQVAEDENVRDSRKQEFREKIITDDSDHFDEIYELYLKYTSGSGQASMFHQLNAECKKIAKIMNTFKRFKVKYKLSNQLIVSLYQRFLKNEDNSDLVTDFDESTQSEICSAFKYFPRCKILHIEIENKIFSLRLDELISNMLDTFYHECDKLRFTVEEMFNDVIFLDYLVAKETQEQNIEELVDQYLKLTLMIDREKEKIDKYSSKGELDGIARREIFEQFFRLKTLHKNKEKIGNDYESEKKEFMDLLLGYGIKYHFDTSFKLWIEEEKIDENSSEGKLDGIARSEITFKKSSLETLYKNKEEIGEYYEIEKQKFMDFLLRYRIKPVHFHRLHKLCIEADYDLKNEGKVERVKEIIKNLRKEQRNYKFSSKIISSLYNEVVKEKGNVSVGQVRAIVGYEHEKTIEKIVEKLKTLYTSEQLFIRLDTESLIVSITKIVADMLEAFEGKFQFINNDRILRMVKKLIKVDYTAPYIVRLLKRVGNDELIERDDLKKLVATLMTEKGSLYVECVKELLYIKSGKLNLYEEVFNQIRDHNLDIRNLRSVFEIPQHAEEILDLLYRRIDGKYQDDEFNKTVEITRDALELFGDIISEKGDIHKMLDMVWMQLINRYHKMSSKKLLDQNCSINVFDEFGNVRLLLTIAELMDTGELIIEKGLFDPYYKILIYFLMLGILNEVPVTITYVKDQLRYFSVLYYRAQVYERFYQYDEYFAVIDNLHREIVKFSLGSDPGGDTHTKKIFAETESSENYKTLLSSAGYLELQFRIARISLYKGFNMILLATRAAGNKVDTENVENGLRILREVFSHEKKHFRIWHEQVNSGAEPSWINEAQVIILCAYNEIIEPMISHGKRQSYVWEYQAKLNLLKEILEYDAYCLATIILGIKHQIKISGYDCQAVNNSIGTVIVICRDMAIVRKELESLKSKNNSGEVSQLRIRNKHRKRSK